MAALRCRMNIIRQCPLVMLARMNSNMASITKIKRSTYLRMYPTMLVLPDGSTVTIRYHEPRQIIKLPLKFEELSPEEQQIVLTKRKPIEKVVVQEEFEDTFDSRKYLKLLKKEK